MLSLSFLVSVLSFSIQKPYVTNPMSILYTSPMTDKKTTHHLGLWGLGLRFFDWGLGLGDRVAEFGESRFRDWGS